MPAGTYDFEVTLADSGETALTVPGMVLEGDTTYDLVLMGQPGDENHPLELRPLSDTTRSVPHRLRNAPPAASADRAACGVRDSDRTRGVGATGAQHLVRDALARDEGTSLTGVVGSGAMTDVLFSVLFPAGSPCASGGAYTPSAQLRDQKREGHPRVARAGGQDLTNFDVFMLALSVLSIVNLALAIASLKVAVHDVVLIVDGVPRVREPGERR